MSQQPIDPEAASRYMEPRGIPYQFALSPPEYPEYRCVMWGEDGKGVATKWDGEVVDIFVEK